MCQLWHAHTHTHTPLLFLLATAVVKGMVNWVHRRLYFQLDGVARQWLQSLNVHTAPVAPSVAVACPRGPGSLPLGTVLSPQGVFAPSPATVSACAGVCVATCSTVYMRTVMNVWSRGVCDGSAAVPEGGSIPSEDSAIRSRGRPHHPPLQHPSSPPASP